MPDQKNTPPPEGGAGSATPPPAAPPAGVRSSGGGGTFWLIPAVTFLAGVALGAVVVGVTTGGDDSSDAAGTPRSTPSVAAPVTPGPTSRPDATVVVPGACLQLADGSQQVLDLLQEAAAAARDLDAAALNTVVRSLQQEQIELQALGDACRLEAVTPSPGATPA